MEVDTAETSMGRTSEQGSLGLRLSLTVLNWTTLACLVRVRANHTQ